MMALNYDGMPYNQHHRLVGRLHACNALLEQSEAPRRSYWRQVDSGKGNKWLMLYLKLAADYDAEEKPPKGG